MSSGTKISQRLKSLTMKELVLENWSNGVSWQWKYQVLGETKDVFKSSYSLAIPI